MTATIPDYRAPAFTHTDHRPAGVCPVCQSPSDWRDKLDIAERDAQAQRQNWSQLVFQTIGEFAECIDDEVRDLRAKAFVLLQQATEREQAIRRDLDRQIAAQWAQEHLTEAENRLSTAQGELRAHNERQDRLAHIVADLDDLEARSDSAVEERDQARTIDARLEHEARLVAIQRMAETLNVEAASLRVPCDPLVLQSRIDSYSMDVESWKQRASDGEVALSAYVENIRKDYAGYPDRLQAAVQLRQFPVSRLAFEEQS